VSLETGSYIEDLVETNPVGATDFVGQGDDHIRLVKKCIKGSFPSLGQNAVSLTALQINDAALKSVSQTISGAWTFSGTLTANLFSGSGASLTSLNASNISSGTLADGRLSSNVALKNAANAFTAAQSVTVGAGAALDLNASGAVSVNFDDTVNSVQAFVGTTGISTAGWGSLSNHGASFYTNSTVRGTISSAGNWTINAPGSGTALTVAGAANERIVSITGAGQNFLGTYNTQMTIGDASSRGVVFGTDTSAQVGFVGANSAGSQSFLAFLTYSGGAWEQPGYFGRGLVLGSPTGNDKGVGTLNAAGAIYQNNVAVQSLPLVNSTSTTLAKGQIHHISGTATIPTLAAGEWVCVVNTSGSGITINKVTSSTAYWTTAGSSISNSVTLGPRGRLVVSGDGSSYFFTGDITGTA